MIEKIKLLNKNKNIWSCILFALMVALILCLLYFFSQQVTESEQKQNKSRMQEFAAHNSEFVKSVISEKTHVIEIAALNLVEYEELHSDQALQKIKEIENNSRFNIIAIDFLDGSNTTSDGSTLNDITPEYLDKIKEGKAFIFESLPNSAKEEIIISIVSPIIKDNVIIGAVRGCIYGSEFKNMLSKEFYGDEGKTILEDGRGNLIVGTDEANIEDLEYESFYKEEHPVGVNDWNLTVLAPKDVVDKYAKEINHSAKLLGLAIFLAMLVLFLFLLWILKRSKDQIQRMDTQLFINEKRFEFMLERMDNIFFEIDLSTGNAEFTERFETVFGRAPTTKGIPHSWSENKFIFPKDRNTLLKIIKDIDNGNEKGEGTVRIQNGGGKYIWCKITMIATFNDYSKCRKVFGVMENINKKKEEEEKYREIQIYKDALDSDRVSIFEVNLTRDIYLKGYIEILQMSGMEEKNIYSQIQEGLALNYIYPEDKEEFNLKAGLQNLILGYDRGLVESVFDFRIKVGKGKYGWARYKIRLYKEPVTMDICCIISLMDVNFQKCRELELMKKAELDQLTGLYNKTTMENMVKEYLISAEIRDEKNALFIIDLDNFKDVNDKLGHYKGDLVLMQAASKLKPIFRSDDIIGRLGGDEFFVFMKKCDSDETVMKKAKAVVEAFHMTCREEQKEVRISASIGVAISPGDGITFDDLYKKADKYLYISKRSGKDTYT